MKELLRQEPTGFLEKEDVTGTVKQAFLGIDSGVSGAWAFITDKEQVVRTGTYRDGLLSMIIGIKSAKSAGVNLIACLEAAHAMPMDGKVSVSTYIEAYGIVQGILMALEVPFEFVASNRWQKAVWDSVPTKIPRMPVKGDVDEQRKAESRRRRQNKEMLKNHCNEFVARRWPCLAPTVAVKKNQGIADAICIALYLKRKMKGG